MNFVANIPYTKCWVRKEYLHDLERGHGEFVEAVIIAVKSVQGRALMFEAYLPEYGACFDKFPLSAFVWKENIKEEDQLPLGTIELWDSFSSNIQIWTKSLLNILGFSYEQFNTSNLEINRQTRFDNTKFNSTVSTTNALVNSVDVLDFTRNVFGAKMYNLQPALSLIPDFDPSGKLTFDLPPNIEENCSSTEIFADNLPKKMSSSHYVVRSSILDQSNYSNSKSKYPIIAIVPRSNQFGDYYVSEEDQIEFTVTQKRTITDITTEIVNPSGELTVCDKESAIIYKLTKFINLEIKD